MTEEQQQTNAPAMTDFPLDFSAFHEKHRPAYIRWAERHLGNRQDAEDAVDKAILQIFDNWAEILTKENVAGYAWRVMQNRVHDQARFLGRQQALWETLVFETTTLRQALDPFSDLENNLALRTALQKLSGRQRDVIVMRHYLGFSPQEVAEHLGMSEPTVRSTDRYARRRMHELLTTDTHEKEGRTP